MFDVKSLKKALICLATLIGGSILIPVHTRAASCSSTISGTVLSGVICDFDTNSSVTISSGGEVGGISQSGYNPINSFITNSGTISNSDTIPGINIDGSSLTNGITNDGVITTDESSIVINNSSVVSGGFSNSGSITSTDTFGFQLDNDSTMNGNISNSGSIISTSINNPALLIRANSTLNGNIINSGNIRAYGDGDGLYMSDSVTITGNIINSGTIRGYSGIDVRNVSRVNGSISNSGIITGDTNEGISIIQSSQVDGDITNSGTVSGNNNGVSVDTASTVNGSIINQAGATIMGSVVGIYINDGSTVNSGIQNYGTITGSTYAISINSDSSVSEIDIYTGSTINGAIDAINTDVNINGGDINGTMNVNAVNINSGATFTMDNSITVQDAVNNAGTLAIGSTSQTIIGNYTQATGGILQVDVTDISTYGQLVVTGAVDLSQSGVIDLNVASGSNIVAGDTLSDVISGATLVVPTDGFSVSDNSRLLNFTGVLNGSNTGVNIAAVDDASTSVSQSNSTMGNRGGASAAAKLDEIISLNPSGDFGNVIGALNNLSSDQEITNATNQTTPALTGATNNAIIETMNTALRIVQDRQEEIKTNRNLWIKTFGSWGKQGNQNGVIGYDSNTYGLIAGADKDITDQARVGAAVSYFNQKLSSNNDYNRVNVDSFLGILYGSYSFDDKVEANAQVAAGYNNSHSTRYINFGSLNRIAKGNYDGLNFHAGSGISRLVNVNRATTIAPQFRLDYFTVGNQSYNESGADALNLYVASQIQSQLIPALEVKADRKFTNKISLTLNTGLGYDLLHNRNNVSASFAGGGGEFTTRGLSPSPWIIRSGFGVTWKQSDELDWTTRYDRRDRGNYDNQTFSLKFRMMF